MNPTYLNQSYEIQLLDGFFSSSNSPKNLDMPFKMDLDFWIVLKWNKLYLLAKEIR